MTRMMRPEEDDVHWDDDGDEIRMGVDHRDDMMRIRML